MPDFDLNRFLPYQLAVASARVSRSFAQRYRAEFAISIPEWRVLAHLAACGKVSVREIHAQVDMDKSKISRAASRLEAAGYLNKAANPADRRLLELTLTAKGKALVARIVPVALTCQDELVAGLGAEREAFESALARLGGV